jgi:peptide chain release factor subunit 1
VTEHWVVSCYLKLEPRDRSRGKYLIKLKNRIREQLARFEHRGATRQELDTVERDLRRVREHLEHPGNLTTGQGIAVFACEALGLFEAIPLPRVFRSRLAIERSPLIRELAALEDEFGRMLCGAYDRTSARFFEITAFGVRELPGLTPGDTTRPGRFHGPRAASGTGATSGSAGEHNYHQRIREEKHRHYAAVAQRLFELSRDRAVRGVVLAGMGKDADAVEPHMHPYLGKQLLGTARLNPKSVTPAKVMETVLEVRRRSERTLEAERAEALCDGLGTGWAVNGVDAVLAALGHGQVRTLLVEPTAERSGFRCPESGGLAVRSEDCLSGGEAEPIADVIDEAIEEALRQGSHVEVVEDGEARAHVDGLAALLRFKQR